MKKLKAWYHQWTIKEQIRWALIGLSGLSALLLAVIGFLLSKNLIERSYREDFTYNLQVSNEIMDIQLKNIIEISRKFLVDEKTLTYTSDDDDDKVRRDQSLMGVLRQSCESDAEEFTAIQTRALENAVGPAIYQDMLIGEMVVIDNTGKLYSYVINTGASRDYDSSVILNSSWLSLVDAARGKEVFFGSNVLKEDSYMFSMVKKLIDPKDYMARGYLIVNIRQKLLEDAFGNSPKNRKSQCLMAINPMEANKVAYFTGDDTYRDTIEKAYLEKGALGSGYVTAQITDDITGWTLVSAIRKGALTKDTNVIGILLLAIFAALWLLAMKISKIISARIYAPLYQLENVIDAVGEGQRHIKDEFDDSEIGRIGTKFKEMVSNNLELREHLLSSQLKEREAELLLLQSQINPHFLYNTLDSLYCMAVIHEADDMAGMVDALSRTFRLSLNKGNKLILVKNEVEHIKAYMEVQNFRFQDRFTLILNIDAAMMELYMLKFILQPFVENAMYHGLEPKVGRGTITVEGHTSGDDFVFVISDDGVGVEDLSVLDGGYGIRNVCERIHLFYGEGYGVTFESMPGQGTRVTIRIAAVYTKGEIHNEEGRHC